MDALNMPIGNGLKPGTSELNFIYVVQPQKKNPAGQVRVDDMRYTKLFTGVTDRLQVDVDFLDISHADNYAILNAYYTALKENAQRPSLILGATNLTGEDWLGGRDFGGDPDNDDPSAFVLSAYTVMPSKRPSLSEPMVRLHLAWGDNFHGDRFFGMLQFKVHPRVGGAIQNYKGMPIYGLTYQATDRMQVSSGTVGGSFFWRVGGVFDW
jgi:hypothetical protein